MGQPGKGAIAKSPDKIDTRLVLYNFDIDGTSLKSEHTQWLDGEVVPLLKANPKATVSILGTASKSGNPDDNRKRSQRRAEEVQKYLISKGVSSAQVPNANVKGAGADLSKVSLKEYEGDRAVQLNINAPLTIEEVSFWNDSWTKKLGWDDIIGLDEATATVAPAPGTRSPIYTGTPINNVSVQVEATGAPRSFMPDRLTVQLSSRVPNLDKNGGKTTLSTPISRTFLRSPVQPKDPSRTWYRGFEAVANIGPFLAWDRGKVLEVALVVREGGTSDKKFRAALGGMTFRGRGVQSENTSAGSELDEIPDAKRLLQAGGVEVLEAKVVSVSGWELKSPSAARLIRSPADVLYYSGHGLHQEGCLALHGNFHGYSVDHYRCWAYPWDLLPYWKPPFDLGVLIIAGCSVLDLDKNGDVWARLLKAKGGPLDVILGYEAGAPYDSNGGDDIAAAMGVKIAAGLSEDQWVRAWLTINGTYHAWNAVGFDSRGRWWLDEPSRVSKGWHKYVPGTSDTVPFDIKGPKPIP
jgi:hypothetical protein